MSNYQSDFTGVQIDAVIGAGTGSVFNVKSYASGDIGSGEDATSAFQAAIAAIEAAGGGVLFVPKGIYLLTEQVVAEAETIRIRGEGALSEMRWNAASGGFRFNATSAAATEYISFDIDSILLTTTEANGGTALKVDYSGGWGSNRQAVRIGDEVEIRGVSGSTDNWTRGIHIDGAARTSIGKINIVGRTSDGNHGSMTEGIYIEDSAGINPTDIYLDEPRIWFADKAVRIGDGVTGNTEGVVINNPNFVLNNYGVYWNTSEIKPWLNVNNGHISSWVSCVYARKLAQFQITGNLLYVRDETTENFTAIDVETSTSVGMDSQIYGNTIRCNKALTPTTNAFKINGKNVVLDGNTVFDADVAIEVVAGSSGIILGINGLRDCTTNYSIGDTTSAYVFNPVTGPFRADTDYRSANYWQYRGGAASGSSPLLSVAGSDTNVGINFATKGSGVYSFYTSGTLEQLRINHQANAVNYPILRGGQTGGSALFAAGGTDTNVNMEFRTQAAGGHFFTTNGGSQIQFQTVHVASAVNRLQAAGGAAGNAPALSCVGSDTDIDLSLSGKGAGLIRFGTHSALSGETVTGFITIKDAAGNSRKIAVVSA